MYVRLRYLDTFRSVPFNNTTTVLDAIKYYFRRMELADEHLPMFRIECTIPGLSSCFLNLNARLVDYVTDEAAEYTIRLVDYPSAKTLSNHTGDHSNSVDWSLIHVLADDFHAHISIAQDWHVDTATLLQLVSLKLVIDFFPCDNVLKIASQMAPKYLPLYAYNKPPRVTCKRLMELANEVSRSLTLTPSGKLRLMQQYVETVVAKVHAYATVAFSLRLRLTRSAGNPPSLIYPISHAPPTFSMSSSMANVFAAPSASMVPESTHDVPVSAVFEAERLIIRLQSANMLYPASNLSRSYVLRGAQSLFNRQLQVDRKSSSQSALGQWPFDKTMETHSTASPKPVIKHQNSHSGLLSAKFLMGEASSENFSVKKSSARLPSLRLSSLLPKPLYAHRRNTTTLPISFADIQDYECVQRNSRSYLRIETVHIDGVRDLFLTGTYIGCVMYMLKHKIHQFNERTCENISFIAADNQNCADASQLSTDTMNSLQRRIGAQYNILSESLRRGHSGDSIPTITKALASNRSILRSTPDAPLRSLSLQMHSEIKIGSNNASSCETPTHEFVVSRPDQYLTAEVPGHESFDAEQDFLSKHGSHTTHSEELRLLPSELLVLNSSPSP